MKHIKKPGLLPAATTLTLLLVQGIRSAAAFAPPSSPSSFTSAATAPISDAARVAKTSSPSLIHSRLRRVFPTSALSAGLRLEDEDDYLDDEEEEEDDDEGLSSLYGKKLGINIGAQLPALSPEEIADIKKAAQETLDAAVDSRLADIEKLRAEMRDDLDESRSRMETAARLNVQLEKQNLMEKIDRISDEFLNKDKDFREATKRAADADKLAGSTGRGVDWGSWGDGGDGEVIVSGGGATGGQNRLLGSVDAARRQSGILADERDGSEGPVSAMAPAENRVLIVADEKDKGVSAILTRLTALLFEAFDSDIIVDTVSPSSNVPIGGNNAQTAIIFASSLNDRSSLESLLGGILKRTAPVAGGAPGSPPGHVVVVSALGTERTNKMPYSMQNLFGGRLDKLREIEQAVASISRSRIAGRQPPLDYTVVKLGDVAGDDEAGGNDGDVSVAIRPGDVLDGGIGPNAAANVLLQAAAFQPYARNSTLCATGSLPASNAPADASSWNDRFLCLSGPELLRVDAGQGADPSEGGVLDAKFEQLRQYVKQWSAAYEGDRKGTGLTTPVLVRRSRRPASRLDGVVARSGVRILFQTTNTGDRYKSASEERMEERERTGGGVSAPKRAPSTAPPPSKARKEGGVEVLVEKTTDGNVRVRARRCNMDNKTIVKEMSEEVIVKSLKKAVEAWMKARAVAGF